MMTVRQLFNDGMALLGVYNPDTSPQTARDHVLNDINGAIQMMSLSGEDFFCRQEISVSLIGGIGSYDLPSYVQTVLNPVRLSSGQMLMGLPSRTQIDDFGAIYLGNLQPVAAETPLAYFVESLRSTSGNDSVNIRLHVAPAPATGDTLTVNIKREPPTYTAADLCGVSPVPPVPHIYHETILLPLVRMNVTTSELFSRNKDKMPQIESDYQRALTLLSLADPRRPKPGSSNAGALQSQPSAEVPEQ